ncbi:MAG: nucleotidyl transferase AbiEii/AbiGii toxin family protein [Desulfuromonas sp.]|nr:nucleotidyl transferase AbiEii/AbiGii toxin family protein [Desulfuromonas sp.]
MLNIKDLEPTNFDYLLDETKAVLYCLRTTAPFLSDYCLVGGSALALYLRHRKSEDLDFFTFADSFDAAQIMQYMRQFSTYEVINKSPDQLDLLLNGVKVTFFNAKWSFLRPEQLQPLNVASLSAIAAMKINVLFVRAKYRDYYDLYCLAKRGMGVRAMFDCALPIVDGLTFKLFSVALLYIDDIDDDTIAHLEPEEIVDKKEIRSFFENQLKAELL